MRPSSHFIACHPLASPMFFCGVPAEAVRIVETLERRLATGAELLAVVERMIQGLP